MSDFKTRLIDEEQQLNEKIEKLSAFLGSENFSKIDEQQQLLLNQQLPAMKSYSEILRKRIELLG